jgi:hypothetical protein
MSKDAKHERRGFGQKHNNLFGPGPNIHLNACVGRNGGPADFYRYAFGYFDAGDRLVRSLQEDPALVDCVIYPLVHLYRHGIETVLKHLGRQLPFLCGDTAEIKLTHKLLDNWVLVRPYLQQLGADAETLDRVGEKLQEIVEIDPNGETFRYPEAIDGTLHLQDTSLINVEVFAEEMEWLASFFKDVCYHAEDLFDAKCEAVQEQREMEREMADSHGSGDSH